MSGSIEEIELTEDDLASVVGGAGQNDSQDPPPK